MARQGRWNPTDPRGLRESVVKVLETGLGAEEDADAWARLAWGLGPMAELLGRGPPREICDPAVGEAPDLHAEVRGPLSCFLLSVGSVGIRAAAEPSAQAVRLLAFAAERNAGGHR